jgi:DNA polymerase III delta prime subunit
MTASQPAATGNAVSDPVLYFFTSAGCHLCETAEALLRQLFGENISQVRAVEISDSDELVERYGTRIPVVAYKAENCEWRELGWPFDAAKLADFLLVD